MNDGNLPGSVRKSLANVLFGTIAIVFAVDLILPVFLASLVRTDDATAVGRLGFLGPVLIVADTESRRSLIFAAIGAIASATTACVLGTSIGLATAGNGGGLFRIFRWLTFLPGRMPAWVVPACVAASYSDRISELSQGWGLIAWVTWAGWWGATRVAAAFAETVTIVPRVEWDAAKILGRSKAATFRSVLAPRLSGSFRKTWKRVVLVTLFDPAPVLFLGVKHWPIGEVFGLLRQVEVRYAVEAASWILWLFLVAAAVNSISTLVFRNRGRDANGGHGPAESSSIEKESGAVPKLGSIRGIAFIGAWPVLLISASLAYGLSAARISTEGSIRTLLHYGLDGLFATAFLNGLLFAVSAAIFIEVIARIGPGRRLTGFASELESYWSLELAICGIAIGAICSTGLSIWILPKSAGFPGISFWPIALVVFVVSQIRSPSLENGMRRATGILSGSGSYQAAFDSALTLGLARRRADALARRADRGRSRGIGWFSLVLSGWWLWISPAWAFVPMWGVVSVPVGGQILAERLLADHDGVRFEVTLLSMLATSALLAIASALTRGRSGD